MVCAKTISVIINFTFLLLGFAVIGAGVWIHVNRDSLIFMQVLHGSMTDILHYFLLSVGTVLVAIGFMGCFGACTESVCFLGFCSFLCVLIIVCEIILGCLVSFISKELFQVMLTGMQYGLHHQYNTTGRPVTTNGSASDRNNVTLAWDLLQVKFNCCGVLGPLDYRLSAWYNRTNDADGEFVPASCCLDDDSKTNKEEEEGEEDEDEVEEEEVSCQVGAILYPRPTTHRSPLKTKGCQVMIIQWISENRSPAISALCLLAVVQIINLFSSCILLSSIRKKMSDYSWSEEEEEVEME